MQQNQATTALSDAVLPGVRQELIDRGWPCGGLFHISVNTGWRLGSLCVCLCTPACLNVHACACLCVCVSVYVAVRACMCMCTCVCGKKSTHNTREQQNTIGFSSIAHTIVWYYSHIPSCTHSALPVKIECNNAWPTTDLLLTRDILFSNCCAILCCFDPFRRGFVVIEIQCAIERNRTLLMQTHSKTSSWGTI